MRLVVGLDRDISIEIRYLDSPARSESRKALISEYFHQNCFCKLVTMKYGSTGNSDSCKFEASISMGCFVTFRQFSSGGSKSHGIVPNSNSGHGVPPGLLEIKKNIRTS